MYNSLKYDELDGDYILVDLRSPEEFEECTIPGAVNIPIFENKERKLIGTVYNHESIDKAKKIGINYASKRLPELYSKISELRDKHGRVVLFCERGGMRSSSVCALFNSIGLGVTKLMGGYKGYRSVVNAELPKLNEEVSYIVIHGYTGTGKTELLALLESRGHDVLDLEKYANHRGSLLGDVGLGKGASQKHFESCIHDKLRKRKAGLIFVEGESSRIGNIVVPHYIMQKMKSGIHILAEGSLDSRIRRILGEYIKSDNCKEEIINSLLRLGKHISQKRIAEYIELVNKENYYEVAKDLMIRYYDPLYLNEQKEYEFDLTVNTNDLESACSEIEKWLQSIKPE
ncbi:MAG: tRNA 2-selenouridine(34) synthase MnmH [Caulobacteraceae bacterium]